MNAINYIVTKLQSNVKLRFLHLPPNRTLVKIGIYQTIVSEQNALRKSVCFNF